MKRVLWATATVASLALCGSAAADWEYTRWGMTAQEVVAASGGQVALDAGTSGDRTKGFTVGAVGRYEFEGYHFRSVFYFNDSGLALIKNEAELKGYDHCMDLIDHVQALYGAPEAKIDEQFMTARTWHDPKTMNFASVLAINSDNGSCSLDFQPLAAVLAEQKKKRR
ncbi:hypothetical protein [Caulobacter sp. 17J65-9]|uniref:hypothetical protein n=1 Tax=Caulobacter sp. 17J65-9 TaxID=2709382 RepID=UPI0013C78F48|nr:hypothetical protein [Caulobacter sp. 17J65-9]NEX94209.1 hypothetical protein [Caulobacter sp. 17J65-9]